MRWDILSQVWEMPVTGSTKHSQVHILGIAGGSGSGKTHFARALQKKLGSQVCEIVYQDSFYHDQSSRFDFDGGSVNFDHPDALDFKLMAAELKKLKKGQSAQIPIYDFVTHSRQNNPIEMPSKPIILVDGILIFHSDDVRSLFDDMIFFDTDEDLRFQRRLERDVHERGRKPEGVRNQFYKQVKPMHDQFVEPSKKFARVRVTEIGDFDRTLLAFETKLQTWLKK